MDEALSKHGEAPVGAVQFTVVQVHHVRAVHVDLNLDFFIQKISCLGGINTLVPKLSYLRLEAGFCQRVKLEVVVPRARRREGARGEVEGGVGVGALAVVGDDAAVAFEAALPHGAEEHPLPGGPSQGLQLSPRRSHLALEGGQLGLQVNSLRRDLSEVGFFLSF